MGRIFKINNRIQIVAKWENTSRGFRHRATLFINGREIENTTVHYLNRTWESYEFETVVKKLISKTKALSPVEKVTAMANIGF
ncbi:MAG: hypothetical protein KAJ49_05980 [Arcobacteraceae bacterium]|nr:hypothetical protein [Arcobacteraceae bacterium]